MKEPATNDVADLNFVVKDLQYSSILDISFYTRLLHHFLLYFGKINSSISAPPLLGYVYYIVVTIQSFLPAFLVDCEDIWPRDSLISMILYVLGYFYQGPHPAVKKWRVIVSVIISVIFIVLFSLLVLRTLNFCKTGRVSMVEMKLTFYLFKYVIPLFCPHMMSGLVISFDQIVNEKKIDYNVLQIVFSLLSFACYVHLLYAVVSPRIVFEDTPSHDYFPVLTVLIVANTSVSSVVSGIAGCVGKNRAACSIWMLIQSCALGLLFFVSNGIVKSIFGIILSATFFAAAFASLFVTVDLLISKPLAPEVLFIVAIVVLIALVIVLKILKQMKATKILQDLQDFMNSGDLAFQEKYKRPINFMCDIQAVAEFWLPYSGDFELFETAVSTWPDDFSLLLLYSRLVAIFPNKNYLFAANASKIASLEEKTTHTSYLYQFRYLLNRRTSTSMTPAFQDKLEQINSKTEIINDTLKRFWENVLQKNTVNFWSDSSHIISQIDDLDSLYAQLLDDYPNNYQLLNSYQIFTTKIKKDFNESNGILRKMETLKQNGSIKSNFALEVALQVFPQLNNCIQSASNNQIQQSNNLEESENESRSEVSNEEESNEIKNNLKINEADKNSKHQLECALTDLIDHSKLGSIWITCTILLVFTVIIIVVFYLYDDYFISNFIIKQRNAVDFLYDLNILSHKLSFFCININMLPLFLENETYTPILIRNRTSYTEEIAPELFSQGRIPEFSVNVESLNDQLSNIKLLFTKVREKLTTLNKNDEYVQLMDYLFYKDKKYGSTLIDITDNLISLAFDQLKAKTLSEFFDVNGPYYTIRNNFIITNELNANISTIANLYASDSYDSSYRKLDDIMIYVNLITLFLFTIPFLIQLFILIIQSGDIAESFHLFPNTEIRTIITSFGKESSKIEEDTTQIASLNNIRKKNNFSGTTTALTFLASFIAVLICSLVIYFDARKFVEKAESVSLEIYSLTPAFTSLILSFTQTLRFYMLTHDGTVEHMNRLDLNLYGSEKDNLIDSLNSAFAMLNRSYQRFSTGFYGENGVLNVLNKDNGRSFDYFNDVFPNDYNQIVPKKSFFEELATCSFYESFNHVKDYIWYYLIDAQIYMDEYKSNNNIYTLLPLGNEVPKMKNLIYWFSGFSEVNRTQIFFDMVHEDVYNKIKKYKVVPDTCLYVVIVWQILVCFLMILFLLNRHLKIKKSLLLYKYIKPEIILQNQKILTLIDSGRYIENDNDSSFSNANYIISKISQGVIITKKNFTITNFNESFVRMFQLNGKNIEGEILTDLIDQDGQEKSWSNFIQHVEDSISGRNKSQFNENFSVKIKKNQICHFSCNVICLTQNSISNSSDFEHIEKVAFVFDDNTEIFMREQLILQEKKYLNKLLSNVIPSRMVHSLANSSECISFIVQSVSIGLIRIKTTKIFNEDSYEAFEFYNEIFDRFDSEIKHFDLLTKKNNFAHTYSFVGGLFSEINKPERHAEEAIRFSLKLLSIIPELSEKFGAEIHLTIGVHTGGPIIAGVLGFDNPTFQIIGAVSEMANQVKNRGVPDQICITRAVYELIYSASFTVQEQGDTKIRGGKIIPTYLVKL